MQYKLKKIRSDASFREFFRLKKGNKTSIIVTAMKERFRNLVAYSAINKFLNLSYLAVTIIEVLFPFLSLKNSLKDASLFIFFNLYCI